MASILSPISRPARPGGGGPDAHPARRPRQLNAVWVSALALGMMVVSDYKLRQRAPGQSLAGSADLAVLVEIVVYGLVAAFLFLQVARPPRLRRTPLVLVAGWCFAATLALSVVYAIYPMLALARGVQLLVTAGLANAIALFASRRHLHQLVHWFLLVVGVSVAVGLALPFPQPEGQGNRFNWFHVHPVMAATYLGLAVVLVLGLLMRNRQRWPSPAWPNWAYGVALAVTVGGLLATRTRGALAACILGCFVVAMSSVRRKSRLDILVLSTIVGVLVAILAADEVLSFLKRGETSSSLRTLSARTVLWEEALDLFADRPVFGYGLTASRGLFFDVVGLGGAHNAVVNVMVDAGVFGLVALVALLWVLVRSARALRGAGPVGDDVPLLLGVVTFLLANSFTAEFLATPANVANVWLFVAVGWVAALQRMRAQEETAAAPPPASGGP